MKEEIHKEIFRDGGENGSWGFQSFTIEGLVKILAGGLIEGATDVEFHWNMSSMEMRLIKSITIEEAMEKEIKAAEDQVEKKKQQLEEYLQRKNG